MRPKFSFFAIVVFGLALPVTASAVSAAPTAQQLAIKIKTATTTPTKVNLASQIQAAQRSSYKDGPCFQEQSTPGNQFSQCDFGAVSAKKIVVLLGDSTAAMWLPAFDAAGRAHQFHVILLARIGCNLHGIILKSWTGAVDPQCAVFRSAAVDFIKNLQKPQVFIVQQNRNPVTASGHPVTSTEWISAMKTFYSKLKAAGATVAFIEPAPVDPIDAATCLSQNSRTSTKCNFPASAGFIRTAKDADDQAAAAAKVPTINTLSLFCTSSSVTAATICPVQVDGTLVYADRWHINRRYSEYVWQGLAALLKL